MRIGVCAAASGKAQHAPTVLLVAKGPTRQQLHRRMPSSPSRSPTAPAAIDTSFTTQASISPQLPAQLSPVSSATISPTTTSSPSAAAPPVPQTPGLTTHTALTSESILHPMHSNRDFACLLKGIHPDWDNWDLPSFSSHSFQPPTSTQSSRRSSLSSCACCRSAFASRFSGYSPLCPFLCPTRRLLGNAKVSCM